MAAKKNGKKKKVSKAVVVLAILATALFLSGGMLVYAYSQELNAINEMKQVVEVDTIYAGISVGGMDVAGKTYEEAYEFIMNADAQRLERYTATLTVDGRDWKENLPSKSNAKDAVDVAYQYARTGELDARYNAIQELAQAPRDFPITYTTDASRLATLVNSIGDEIDIEPIDAAVDSFDFSTKTFHVSEEAAGRKLDRDAMIADINYAVENELFPITVTGTVNVAEPRVTKEQLSGRNKLLASFSTNTTSDSKRNSNIKLCAEAFNKSVVMPGEVFSLNEKTGRRSTDKGYQEAGAIKNGKLVPEPGGGVCQVSTTLFNAVVRTGMEITERNNHSYPISYIEKGQDAMIDYPNYDFKFTNTTNGPVYLISHFANQKLTIEIYGEPILEEGVRIELRSETTETLEPGATEYINDSTLFVGQEEEERAARTGYRVKTYIQRWKGESMISDEFLFNSYYMPYHRIVRQGTMQYYAPPVVTAPDTTVPDTGGSGLPVIGG